MSLILWPVVFLLGVVFRVESSPVWQSKGEYLTSRRSEEVVTCLRVLLDVLFQVSSEKQLLAIAASLHLIGVFLVY